jgi:hypothetical protein
MDITLDQFCGIPPNLLGRKLRFLPYEINIGVLIYSGYGFD